MQGRPGVASQALINRKIMGLFLLRRVFMNAGNLVLPRRKTWWAMRIASSGYQPAFWNSPGNDSSHVQAVSWSQSRLGLLFGYISFKMHSYVAWCAGSVCQSGHTIAIVSFPACSKSACHSFFCTAGLAQASCVNLTNIFFNICFHFLTFPISLQLSSSYHLITDGWIRTCIALSNDTSLFSVLCVPSPMAARAPTECCQGNKNEL